MRLGLDPDIWKNKLKNGSRDVQNNVLVNRLKVAKNLFWGKTAICSSRVMGYLSKKRKAFQKAVA